MADKITEAISDMQNQADEGIELDFDASPVTAKMKAVADKMGEHLGSLKMKAQQLSEENNMYSRKLLQGTMKEINVWEQKYSKAMGKATAELRKLQRAAAETASESGVGFSGGGEVPTFSSGGPVIRANKGAFIRHKSGPLPGTDNGKDEVPVLARHKEWFVHNEAADHWRRLFGSDGFMAGVNNPMSAAGKQIQQALTAPSINVTKMAEGGKIGSRIDYDRIAQGGTMQNMGEITFKLPGKSGKLFGEKDFINMLKQVLVKQDWSGK
jgi:hypothetical protein